LTFKVMSRNEAVKYTHQAVIPKTLLISICSAYEEEPSFAQNRNILGIVHLWFDDVGKEGENAMTMEDAMVIWNAIRHHTSNTEQILVHCEAGISRSAGVCAGIQKVLTNGDWQIFDNPRYKPNMHCYNMMLKAAMTDN